MKLAPLKGLLKGLCVRVSGNKMWSVLRTPYFSNFHINKKSTFYYNGCAVDVVEENNGCND
jgi:hypothetical protein